MRARKGADEALTGVRAGSVWSHEICWSRWPTLSVKGEGNITVAVMQGGRGAGGVKDPVHARKHFTRKPGDPVADRETMERGPQIEPERDNEAMNVGGKSDDSVVPGKLANKGSDASLSAERVEGRESAKGNSDGQNRNRAQKRAALQSKLDRVRQKAKEEKETRFTTLWHHVYDVDRLREAYFGLERKSAAGVDGETWQQYGQNLEENLRDLSERLKRGAYRAKPVRRVYLPKSDGRKRPIGVPALEDKIAQRSTVEVLNAIYESDFLGFSYGFRPGRSQHDALDAVVVGIERRKVNWVLDVDVRAFFDSISHEWLEKFISHRITDKRVLRHVKKWLKAGVLEEGEWKETTKGSPQGGSVSPLLANVYLHYVFDLWADLWRSQRAKGDVIIVRFADDVIVGFEHREDAERFQEELAERLRKFDLELHPDKTRLIRFGRSAHRDHRDGGGGKPGTFEFLGFVHICGTTRKGGFTVKRRSSAKRMRRTLLRIKEELLRRWHLPIRDQGLWLKKVVRGWFGYHGVPFNIDALSRFRHEVVRRWFWALRRRSQRGKRLTWSRFYRYVEWWLPRPKIVHPFPIQRLRVTTRGRSPVR